MTFNGQQPSFYCKSQNDDINMSDMVPAYGKDCTPNNVTECGGYVFEDSMNTVVNEVCIQWTVLILTVLVMLLWKRLISVADCCLDLVVWKN